MLRHALKLTAPFFAAYWLVGLGVSLLALFACGTESFMLPAMGDILFALTLLKEKLA